MKNISKDTIIRTIVTFVALVNSVLTMIGKIHYRFPMMKFICFFHTFNSVFHNLGVVENNSFTSSAIAGDIVKDESKGKGYTEE